MALQYLLMLAARQNKTKKKIWWNVLGIDPAHWLCSKFCSIHSFTISGFPRSTGRFLVERMFSKRGRTSVWLQICFRIVVPSKILEKIVWKNIIWKVLKKGYLWEKLKVFCGKVIGFFEEVEKKDNILTFFWRKVNLTRYEILRFELCRDKYNLTAISNCSSGFKGKQLFFSAKIFLFSYVFL